MRLARSLGLLAGLSFFLTGCGPSDEPAGSGTPGGAGAQEAPPTQVIAVDAVQSPVYESITLVGDLAPKNMVEIQAESDGVVFEILFEEGDRVEQGAPLFNLDDRKLEAQLAEAQANFKLSEITFERDKKLLQDKLISQQDFDQSAARYEFNRATLKLRERQLRDTQVTAPFAGVLGERQVSPGQVIRASQTLTWLVDVDPLMVVVNVPERFLGVVKEGQEIEFEVNAYPNEKFRGEIYFIAPNVDLESRTAVVKAYVPNPEGRLKPGMFTNLQLILEKRASAIVIPEAALELSEKGYSIMVANSASEANIRPVEVGVRMTGVVEISSGLNAGEKVVVEGRQKLRPGSKVTLAPEEESARYLDLIQKAAPANQ